LKENKKVMRNRGMWEIPRRERTPCVARVGMTLVELVVVIGITGLVLLAVGMWQANLFRYNTALSDQLTSQHEARQTILIMTHELRTAITAATGAYPLESLTGTQLIFYSNIDEEVDIERIRYVLNGSVLQKGVIKPSGNPVTYSGTETMTTLANHVTNGATPIFAYYDSSYTGSENALAMPVNPNVVRYVEIMLIIDKDTNRPPAAIQVRSGVSLRNLKDNL